MRRALLVLLGALGACTLLRDYDELRERAANGSARDAEPLAPSDSADPVADSAADDAPPVSGPEIGCGDDTCAVGTEVCCVSFVLERLATTCAPRGVDAGQACPVPVGQDDRLAGVLECDTSAQCAGEEVCCGDGRARLDNSTVFRARCVPSGACAGNELCGPGSAGPGLLASCRQSATRCIRTADLDVVDEAEGAAAHPLLKCSAD